jgi:predicted CopG family antitoxin
MGSKNISITEEAYDRLQAHKRDDESFTDVILRLTDDERDIMSGFGAWKGTDKADHAREVREQLNAELESNR